MKIFTNCALHLQYTMSRITGLTFSLNAYQLASTAQSNLPNHLTQVVIVINNLFDNMVCFALHQSFTAPLASQADISGASTDIRIKSSKLSSLSLVRFSVFIFFKTRTSFQLYYWTLAATLLVPGCLTTFLHQVH